MEQTISTQPQKKSYTMLIAWILLVIGWYCMMWYQAGFVSGGKDLNYSGFTCRATSYNPFQILKIFSANCGASISGYEIMNPLVFAIGFALLVPIFLSFAIGHFKLIRKRKSSEKLSLADKFFFAFSILGVVIAIRLVMITL